MKIGNKIADARKRQNITQEQLAEQLNKKKQIEKLIRIHMIENIKVDSK